MFLSIIRHKLTAQLLWLCYELKELTVQTKSEHIPARYRVGGGGLLLFSVLLLQHPHVEGEHVSLQLLLGGAEQGAERAAEGLPDLAAVLVADVLLQLLSPGHYSGTDGTLHCCACWAWGHTSRATGFKKVINNTFV